MDTIELAKVFKSKQKDVIEKSKMYICLTLFNILVKGSETMPEIGEAVLDDENRLVITLDQKWIDLLEGDSTTVINSISDELFSYLPTGNNV